MKYERIIRALTESPWAIIPSKLEAIIEVVELRAQDIPLDARPAAQVEPVRRGGVQVIPVRGTIAQRMGLMGNISGGTSTESISRDIDAALASPDVSSIVLDIDSPGGSVFGVQELASKIFEARSEKRVVAVANSLAASAAYWLGSQASEFVVTPSGEVGSIGVIAMHVDQSEANGMEGVKPTFITAGKFKAEGNPHEPLSEEARAAMQERIDGYYTEFVSAVARGRGTSIETVRDGFGEGRVVGAKRAQSLGMVDSIATLDEVIRSESSSSRRPNRMAALRSRANRYAASLERGPSIAGRGN